MLANIFAFLGGILLSTNTAGPEYTVEKKMDNFEIRNYEPWIVAETVVKETHENVGH